MIRACDVSILWVLPFLVFAWVYCLNRFLLKYGKQSSLLNQSTNPPLSEQEQTGRRKITNEIIEHIYPAEYAYWAALLTFNGILIAVFVFVALRSGSRMELVIVVTIAIFLCLFSSALMILNFFSRILMFREQGKLFSQYINVPQDQWNKSWDEHKKRENSEREARERNERWTIILLSLQCMIIVAILLLATVFVIYRF